MRDLIKFAGKIRRMSVGEVATVGQIHRQNLVAQLSGSKNKRPCSPASHCVAGR